MPRTDGGDEGYSHVGGNIPTNHKTALEQIAHDRSEMRDKVFVSDLLRDSVKLFLEEQDPEDLPEETRDLLDDDLVANAGGDDFE